MTTDWDAILLAFLHDPPDKALSIPGHDRRARALAERAISDAISKTRIKKYINDGRKKTDAMASQVERLPMPKPEILHVDVENNLLIVFHPLASAPLDLPVPSLDQDLTRKESEQLCGIALPGQDDTQAFNRFLAVWRLWPEVLADRVDPCFARLPAETRNPDHTIWNHLDTTAAFKAATRDGAQAALLAFALGPVQSFIGASRSVRDLWSGSIILSWLAFRAMQPVIEQLGPTALVYPALRGNPLLDLWLRNDQRLGNKVSLPSDKCRLTPCLPHRFLALVPWGTDGSAARALAVDCERAVATAWQEMADVVKKELKGKLDPLCPDWDKRWNNQISSYFKANTTVLPLHGIGAEDTNAMEHDRQIAELLAGCDSFDKAFQNAEAVRKMAGAIPEKERPGYPQDHAGRWQYHVELVHRSLAAARAIRNVPNTPGGNVTSGRVPQKCSLLGSFEQMGPDDLRESKGFWDRASDPARGLSMDGVRLRKGEALCAVAMVKRFAGPAFLGKELDVLPAELRFPDTWTVAAGEWLSGTKIDPDDVRSKHGDWNGQWLHWDNVRDDPDEPTCPTEVLTAIRADRDRLGKAPIYYAILKLDGDDVSGWLRGENSPKVREVMHPDMVRYYEGLGDTAKAGLEAKRPVSPALHAAISSALANFALYAAPEIVAKHHGTTIYSGGDDMLVLLPVSTALACALELRQAYMSNWWPPDGQDGQREKQYMMMGAQATLSGGLTVVHAKDDLRLALQDARHAEKQAKQAGKDALVITACRRSGEHTSSLCPWGFADTVNGWVTAFLPADGDPGASDRWAYHLKTEECTLAALEADAVRSEIRRQVNRAEKPTRRRLGEPSEPNQGERAGDKLASSFDEYRRMLLDRQSKFDLPTMLKDWLTLCQTASFMARGRDS